MMYRRITFTLCGIEILALIGIATFPALLPEFSRIWHLSNTQAGWISASYYAGYMLSVPFLTGLTDRVDARRIVLNGALLGMIATGGFALLADGFWTAVVLRFAAGVSLAGVYMPGLKIIGDWVQGPSQSRYVSFYTASFSIGTSVSYLIAGEIHRLLGWRWAFGAAALCALAAAIITFGAVPAIESDAGATGRKLRVHFRPVFQCRPAMAFILAYGCHMWEMFAMRTWIVAFLTFSYSLQPRHDFILSATQLAFLINLIGLPASIAGNEVACLFGRRRTLTGIMLFSATLCALIGWLPAMPYLIVVALCLMHGIFVIADSAALTAGAVNTAPAGHRGATLAVHSTVGFGAAFVGPLAVGIILDAFQGSSLLGWGMAYLSMGLACALGPVFLWILGGNANGPADK